MTDLQPGFVLANDTSAGKLDVIQINFSINHAPVVDGGDDQSNVIRVTKRAKITCARFQEYFQRCNSHLHILKNQRGLPD